MPDWTSLLAQPNAVKPTTLGDFYQPHQGDDALKVLGAANTLDQMQERRIQTNMLKREAALNEETDTAERLMQSSPGPTSPEDAMITPFGIKSRAYYNTVVARQAPRGAVAIAKFDQTERTKIAQAQQATYNKVIEQGNNPEIFGIDNPFSSVNAMPGLAGVPQQGTSANSMPSFQATPQSQGSTNAMPTTSDTVLRPGGMGTPELIPNAKPGPIEQTFLSDSQQVDGIRQNLASGITPIPTQAKKPYASMTAPNGQNTPEAAAQIQAAAQGLKNQPSSKNTAQSSDSSPLPAPTSAIEWRNQYRQFSSDLGKTDTVAGVKEVEKKYPDLVAGNKRVRDDLAKAELSAARLDKEKSEENKDPTKSAAQKEFEGVYGVDHKLAGTPQYIQAFEHFKTLGQEKYGAERIAAILASPQSVYDTFSGNFSLKSKEEIVKANRDNEKYSLGDRYVGEGAAKFVKPKIAAFNEIETSSQQVKDALKNPGIDFSQKQIAKFSQVLKDVDDGSTIRNFLATDAAKTLTPAEINYVTAVKNLKESAFALRGLSGMGQVSDMLKTAISAVVPGSKTPNKGYALSSLDRFNTQVKTLRQGIPGLGAEGTKGVPTNEQQNQPPTGYKDSGKTSGGKAVWLSPDGKKAWVAE